MGVGHSLFCCSAPCTAVATFKGAYGGFIGKKEHIPMALGTRYAMCIWKNSCSKRNTLYTHLKNWIFGLQNKVIVEKQENNFQRGKGNFHTFVCKFSVLQLTTTENTITYHNAICLSPQNFA